MGDVGEFPDAAFSGVHRGSLQPGEWITLSDPKGRRHSVKLERGKIFHTTKGGIEHDDLIDGPDAVTIRSKGGVEYLALRPLMADYSVSMPRGAAVIYPKDTAQIVTMADVFPGAKVVEAGAGSGALTTALLRAVGVQGQVISFERREDFAEVARKNVTGFFGGEHPAWRLEVGDLVDKLSETDVDRVVLDMLAPWECVDVVAGALAPGGVFCAYVATTTQLSRFVETLRAHGEFTEPRAWESLVRDWHVEGLAVRPGHRMQGHTAFLVTARRMAPGVKAPLKKRRPAPGAYGDDYTGPRRSDRTDEA
ncbi:tRNA (adenine57-N1/adenine58-N1)-methyltransferase [Kribbella sp. VKM Ac-2527]|uniref:tRNA (adenine(58)-N(1))-methyltransferase TrmI n=1 Tax=Kribbella caucasensis TaxID=2512215 RepID=A0A4R6KCB7_9ACTN|nr:tRNA (adenine-N1)-methyltransferase [Kribbella sp. VKM Ac-2527]TDO47912.1 tRNA (adenine57-N1/adenine58-N1)-methyltransferase [Kribbella sp. VKM Ac-2527]